MLPVFGSVASAMINRPAGRPRASRSAKPASNTTAPCAVPRLNNSSSRSIRGTTATVSNTPAAPKRARIASVTGSGAGSTIASRT